MKNTPTVKRRILISPLNWGLGHATRLLPVIYALQKKGHECLIAGEEPAITVIKEVFPGLKYIPIKGFKVRLSSSNKQVLKLLFQFPAFIHSIFRDRITVQRLVKRYQIDLIISDNRYGFRNRSIPSILITHQTNPETGWFMSWTKPIVNLTLRWWVSRFNACWIPDINASPSISGRLSQKQLNTSTFFTGILSRLSVIDKTKFNNNIKTPDILVILSGPEPQRSQFESLIIKRFINSRHKVLVLQAQPNKTPLATPKGSVTLLPHCDASTYFRLLTGSKQIICRPGYSTLMDLFYINRKAILIPTPGQYEQLYLARHMMNSFKFKTIEQSCILKSSVLENIHDTEKIYPANNTCHCHLPPLP